MSILKGRKRKILILFGGGLLFLFSLIPACYRDGGFFDEVYAESPIKNKHVGTPVYQLQDTFHEVFELYKDSVVFISTEKTVQVTANPFFNDPFFNRFFGHPEGNNQQQPQTQKQTGLGTGFIISEDGYICTNHHVVANVDTVKVKVNEQEYTAKIVGSDPMTDIALLKVEGANNFKPVYFGDSDRVKVGDWAIAIGNPFGLDGTFTVGIISAVARKDVDQLGNSHIQTDASINPGNSGGPLLNIDGEVIGVNRMIYSRTGGNLGIGFAIPINTTRDVLEQLREHGRIKRGYIGVQIAPLTPEFAGELGLKKVRGALVGAVLKGGPAHKAGIKERDVILEVGDREVEDYRDLVNIISRTKIGKTLKVVLWRDGKKINLFVTIQERPS